MKKKVLNFLRLAFVPMADSGGNAGKIPQEIMKFKVQSLLKYLLKVFLKFSSTTQCIKKIGKVFVEFLSCVFGMKV